MTLTENFDIELLHPCVATVISTSQTISPINYTIGSGLFSKTFIAFSDTVSGQYGVGFCGLVYTLVAAADANNYGVYIDATMFSFSINVNSANNALAGNAVTLSIVAHSTPQQTSAPPTIQFIVNMVAPVDPCLTAIIQPVTIPDPLVYQLHWESSSAPFTIYEFMMHTDNVGTCGAKTVTQTSSTP